MEQPRIVAEKVRDIIAQTEPSEVYLCPNHDLEYVPQPYANRKILRLGKIMEIVGG